MTKWLILLALTGACGNDFTAPNRPDGGTPAGDAGGAGDAGAPARDGGAPDSYYVPPDAGGSVLDAAPASDAAPSLEPWPGDYQITWAQVSRACADPNVNPRPAGTMLRVAPTHALWYTSGQVIPVDGHGFTYDEPAQPAGAGLQLAVAWAVAGQVCTASWTGPGTWSCTATLPYNACSFTWRLDGVRFP